MREWDGGGWEARARGENDGAGERLAGNRCGSGRVVGGSLGKVSGTEGGYLLGSVENLIAITQELG